METILHECDFEIWREKNLHFRDLLILAGKYIENRIDHFALFSCAFGVDLRLNQASICRVDFSVG